MSSDQASYAKQLEIIFRATARMTGDEFLQSLCNELCQVFDVRYAGIGTLVQEEESRFQMTAFAKDGVAIPTTSFSLEGSPSNLVVNDGLTIFEGDLVARFPNNEFIKQNDIHCYVGCPLLRESGEVMGLMLILHDQECENAKEIHAILEVFSARASCELSRIDKEQKFRAGKSSHETLLSNLPGMAYRCENNRDWTMSYISDGCLSLTGYAPEEFLHGRDLSFKDITHPEDRDYIYASVQKAIETGDSFELIYRIQSKDGKNKWVWEQGCLVDQDSDYPALEGYIKDMTAQKQAEKNLRENEERLSLAFQASDDCLWDWEFPTGKVVWNVAYEEQFDRGKDSNSNSVTWWEGRIHPEDRKRVLRFLHQAIEGKESRWLCEYRFRKPDGSFAAIAELCIFQRDDKGRVVRAVGTLRDVSERRQLEERILSISEELQQRIGADIHDDLCQQLFGIQCRAQIFEEELQEAGQADEAMRVAEIGEMLWKTNQSARRTAHGLAPMILDSEGLIGALLELTHGVEHAHGVSCAFERDEPGPSCGKSERIQLYRIVQEAMQNAVHHGEAKHIRLSLRKIADEWQLTISDDGVGFPDEIKSDGMGIFTMKHRAQSIGASLEVTGRRSGGTQVTCLLATLPTSDELKETL